MFERGRPDHLGFTVRDGAAITALRDPLLAVDATSGIGPDLMVGARDAVSGMVDLLSARHKITAQEAYMLCSVAGDLRISEIVDMPNWLVSFHMPRAIFE